MAYINVSVPTLSELGEREKIRVLEAKLAFWQNAAEDLQGRLDNIPAAIEKYGQVDIYTRGNDKITLVAKPYDAETGA